MMKLLHIWNGSQVDKEFIPYVERSYKIYPDAEHIWITDQKLPYEGTVIPKKVYSKKIRKECGIAIDSDFVRFKEFCAWMYLSENPYTLFADVDVYMKEKIPETKKTGFWKVDECALWSGNNPKAFKKAFNKRKNNIMLVSCVDFLPKDSIDLEPYCKHRYLKKGEA